MFSHLLYESVSKYSVYFQPRPVLIGFNFCLAQEISHLGIDLTIEINHPLMILEGLPEFFKTIRMVKIWWSKSLFESLTCYFPVRFGRNSLINYYKRLLCKFDLVHFNMWDPALVAVVRENKIPTLITIHVPIPHEEAREIYNNIDILIATSKFVANKFHEAVGYVPTVIYNGVDPGLFHPKIPKTKARKYLRLPLDRKIILWNARVTPQKDPMTLIRAIPRIKREVPDSYFLIKGRAINKALLNKMKKEIQKGGFQSSVRFDIGWVQYNILPLYYRAADIHVHTSLIEGFSLTILEAMASGIPVIASAVASIPEALDKNCLFEPRNHDELAELVCRVLLDEKLKEKLGKRNRRIIFEKHFTWRDAAEKYVSQYKKIIY